MRILHVILTPRHSGAEVLACSLAEVHAASGSMTGIVALNPCEAALAPTWASLSQLGVWCVSPTRRSGRLQRMRFIQRAYREFSPDIVVAHSVIPAAYARVGARLFAPSVPIVSVLHSATNDDYSSLPLRFSEWVLRFAAAAVVTVTDTARKNYEARFGNGRRVETIPNGTQIESFRFNQAARRNLRAAFGVNEQTTVLLQVGRIAPVKGQMSSVLALKRLVDTGHDVVLWLAGLTEDEGYLRDVVGRIAALNLERHVFWLGSRADVPALLCAADIYLMPSMREAHSVAMIEALASGVPVVASKIEVFATVARFDGVARVEPNDSAAYADAVAQFIVQKQRHVRDLCEFSVERVAERYFNLFLQILGRERFDRSTQGGTR
jgi:glycosyltransferase involved in cell wall biosynthesis